MFARASSVLVLPMVLGLVLNALCSTAHAQPATPLEYRVKAAFLFYFANFVDWPESSYASDESPVRLCVLGDDPFGQVLDQVVEKKRVKGRSLEIMRGHSLDALGDCHLLFISESENARLRRILQGVQGKHVLTVYESPEVIRLGGAIGFVLDQRKVRFEINLGATQKAGLTVSSKLLNVARRVVMP